MQQIPSSITQYYSEATRWPHAAHITQRPCYTTHGWPGNAKWPSFHFPSASKECQSPAVSIFVLWQLLSFKALDFQPDPYIHQKQLDATRRRDAKGKTLMRFHSRKETTPWCLENRSSSSNVWAISASASSGLRSSWEPLSNCWLVRNTVGRAWHQAPKFSP